MASCSVSGGVGVVRLFCHLRSCSGQVTISPIWSCPLSLQFSLHSLADALFNLDQSPSASAPSSLNWQLSDLDPRDLVPDSPHSLDIGAASVSLSLNFLTCTKSVLG